MPLISMTGFGSGSCAAGGVKVDVELSSVNRKQFEVRLNLPRPLAAMESRVDSILHERILRGAVTGTVRTSAAGAGTRGAVQLNVESAGLCVRALRDAARQFGLQDDLGASALLQIPDLLHMQDVAEDSDRTWGLLQKALHKALDSLVAMRRKEGLVLETDIRRRFERLAKLLQTIRDLAPRVVARYNKTLRDRLAKAGVPVTRDDPQLLREVVIWVDRCDISEELVRLDSHLQHVEGMLRSKKPVGRALDFLCQEMFREINTIGSKANDVHISRQVVEFKTELESVREQVQNVE